MGNLGKKNFLLGILLILNLILLLIIFKPHLAFDLPNTPIEAKLNQELAHFIDREIGLSSDQSSKLKLFREDYRQQNYLARKKWGEAKKALILNVFQENASGTEAILDEIALSEREMSRLQHQHFLQIVELCSSEQKQRLRALCEEVFFRPPRPQPREKNSDKREK